jgi:hypothetical protein
MKTSSLTETSSKYAADLHDFKMNLSRTLNSHHMAKFNNHFLLKISSKSKKQEPKIKHDLLPVKVIKNANYFSNCKEAERNNNDLMSHIEKEMLINAAIGDDYFASKSDSQFIKSKYSSPFLLRKTSSNNKTNKPNFIQTDTNDLLVKTKSSIDLNDKYEIYDKISHSSLSLSNLTQSDSGFSSMGSTQLFLAELRECLKSESNRFIKTNETDHVHSVDQEERSVETLEQLANKFGNLHKIR